MPCNSKNVHHTVFNLIKNNIEICIYWFNIDVSLQEKVLSVYLCIFIDISFFPALSHFDLLSCTPNILVYKPFTMCSYQMPSSKIPPDIYISSHFATFCCCKSFEQKNETGKWLPNLTPAQKYNNLQSQIFALLVLCMFVYKKIFVRICLFFGLEMKV